MTSALRLLGALLGIWVFSWLSLGLLWGQPTLLLHPLQAPEGLRVTYLVMLYGGLVTVVVRLWKRYPPRQPVLWGSPSEVLGVWLVGLSSALAQRLVLLLGGHWVGGPWPGWSAWCSAALLAPPLAAIEELVFRGYLYAVLRDAWGRARAALGVSAFFALVHLFRPGDPTFKAAYALGLMLVGLVLVLVVERVGLWGAAALHSAWISVNIVDPPGRVVGGWWAGLGGEPTAGLCSWLLLLALAGFCWLRLGKRPG